MSYENTRDANQHFIVVTLNHKKLSLKNLPDFSFEQEELIDFLEKIHACESVAEIAGMCTCNRTEFFAVVHSVKDGAHAIVHEIAHHSSVSLEEIRESLDVLVDAQAIEHLFRLTAALESMVIGDAQILGQVKQAYNLAIEMDTADRIFHSLFPPAFKAAKRVRRETGLGKGRISISALAVDFCRHHFGDLTKITATVIGAGKMGALTAKYLKDAGVKELRITNRSLDRSLELAQQTGGRVYNFDEMEQIAASSDVVVSATAAPDFLITQSMLERNKSQRPNNQLFIDIALPPDIDPALSEIEGVTLIDLDALRETAQVNEKLRTRQIESALEIVQEEIEKLGPWPLPFHIDDIAVGLGQFAHLIYQDEMHNLWDDLPELSEAQRKAIQSRMKRLTERIILTPRRNLRQHKAIRRCPNASKCLAELFAAECGAREIPDPEMVESQI
ncbi:MAG: glutamyl-tRNA reductase [Candidatus Omnitrophica bacterium]|nr:glutamyl-tRNA reductase [Candidatus Omnitrophota bacterium]